VATKDLNFNIFGRDVNASKALDKVGDSVDRLAGRLDGFNTYTIKTFGGLASAATGAGLGVAAGLTMATGGFIAFGAVALRENTAVQDSWRNLGNTVNVESARMAEPLEGHLVRAAGTLQRTFLDLEPALSRGFEAAGPSLDHLVAGVDQFARRAVPGMVLAVERSEPVFVGMRQFLADTGDGVNDFFVNMSEGADSSGRILAEFGGISRDALGTTGSLLATLSNEGAPAVHELAGAFGGLLRAVEGMSTSGMPVLFSTATNLLGVLGKILDIAGPLAPALGTVVGVMLSAKAGAAIFGAAGEAIGNVGTRIERAGERSGKADGALSKLGRTMGAFGPWGAVAGGALLGLSAAADAAWGSTENLAQGLMRGGQAAAAAGAQLASNDLTVATYTSSLSLLTGGGGPLDLFITTTDEANRAVTEQRAQMTTLERAQVDAAAAAANHSRAVETYGETSDQAAATAALLAMRQRDLRNAQDEAARATKTLTEKLLEQQQMALTLANDNLALRLATQQYDDSLKALNEAVTTYGDKSREARDAAMQHEEASIRLVAAAGVEAASHYANRDSVEAQTASLDASNRKALELAASMQGPLPAALQIMIANMDDASLSALGATRTIDGTGSAVVRLPGGKTVTINAADYATATINGIQNSIDNMRGKTIQIHIQQLVSTTGPTMANLGNPAAVLPRAKGGPVMAGRPYLVGEKGPELIFPAQDGFVATARETADIMRGARTQSVRAVGQGTTTAGIEKHYHLTVYMQGNDLSVEQQFRRMELLDR
jgi:hypothetical protein